MPSYPLHALVCDKTKLADSDLILTLLAQDGSQVRAVAKGVRKPKSRLRGTLELFCVADLLCAEGRSLDIITEARLVEANTGCRASLEHTSAASTVCEMLTRLSLEGQPQPHLFDMCTTALSAIGAAPDADALRLNTAATVLKVLSLLGYRPSLTRCARCGSPITPDRGQVGFSFAEGGIICDQCAAHSPLQGNGVTPDIVAWAAALIGSTYAQIAELAPSENVGRDLLAFASRWMAEHAGITCKSLRFLQG